MPAPIRPPVKPGKIPHKVANSTGKTRRMAFERANKYVENTRLKYAAREREQIAGPAYYDGYMAGVKAERERMGLTYRLRRKRPANGRGEHG